MSPQFKEINCPICSSINKEIIYETNQETGDFAGRIHVTFQLCKNCGFVFLSPVPPSDFMNEYYKNSLFSSGSTYSEKNKDSKNYKKNIDRKKFFDKSDTDKKLVLIEIGCSSGDFLEKLDTKKYSLLGIEPSSTSVAIARAKKLNVEEGFLDSFKIKKKYDIVCAFSVLEHLYDINQSMQILSKLIKNGGYLWLEIPDTAKPVTQISEFFCFEHFSHFSLETIKLFLSKYNFGDFQIDETVTDSRIRLSAKKLKEKKELFPDKKQIEIIKKTILNYSNEKKLFENDVKNKLISVVKKAKNENMKILVYGAGAHTAFLVNLVDFSDTILGIIDSDPQKSNKRFLRWNVYNENILEKNLADIIIISSKAFQEEIFRKIQKYQEHYDIIKIY